MKGVRQAWLRGERKRPKDSIAAEDYIARSLENILHHRELRSLLEYSNPPVNKIYFSVVTPLTNHAVHHACSVRQKRTTHALQYCRTRVAEKNQRALHIVYSLFDTTTWHGGFLPDMPVGRPGRALPGRYFGNSGNATLRRASPRYICCPTRQSPAGELSLFVEKRMESSTLSR